MKEDFLHRRLEERKAAQAFRQLRLPEGKTDFCSNDYLGIATKGLIENHLAAVHPQPVSGAQTISIEAPAALPHGSGGSRLLAGNFALIEQTERDIASFHNAEAGLIFNSGYDANLGLLSSVPQRGDTILYDSLSHASIRDGIRLSFAQSHSFVHNDLQDLERRLKMAADSGAAGTVFVVTESVFSMDGDLAPLSAMTALCSRYKAHVIIDEAHATGVVGKKGEGLVQDLGLEEQCFARVHTFGKAVGCHGAIVLGSVALRDYLINFSRSLIYTTALPPAAIAAIRSAYSIFPAMDGERTHLQKLIASFQAAPFEKLVSLTPIQAVIVPGNDRVRALAASLQTAGLDLRPILYPTVPKGSERLRIVLHAFNTIEELDRLTAALQ